MGWPLPCAELEGSPRGGEAAGRRRELFSAVSWAHFLGGSRPGIQLTLAGPLGAGLGALSLPQLAQEVLFPRKVLDISGERSQGEEKVVSVWSAAADQACASWHCRVGGGPLASIFAPVAFSAPRLSGALWILMGLSGHSEEMLLQGTPAPTHPSPSRAQAGRPLWPPSLVQGVMHGHSAVASRLRGRAFQPVTLVIVAQRKEKSEFMISQKAAFCVCWWWGAAWGHTWRCSRFSSSALTPASAQGSLLVRLRGLFVVPGIKPGLAAYKASTFHAVPSL